MIVLKSILFGLNFIYSLAYMGRALDRVTLPESRPWFIVGSAIHMGVCLAIVLVGGALL